MVIFDLAGGQSAWAALLGIFSNIHSDAPSIHASSAIPSFCVASQQIRNTHPGIRLACNNRSDAGFFTALREIRFAGRVQTRIYLDWLYLMRDLISTPIRHGHLPVHRQRQCGHFRRHLWRPTLLGVLNAQMLRSTQVILVSTRIFAFHTIRLFISCT